MVGHHFGTEMVQMQIYFGQIVFTHDEEPCASDSFKGAMKTKYEFVLFEGVL